jgi:hypothetical protein
VFHVLSSALWWLAIGSQFALLLVILWRKHHHFYPAFAALILAKCIKSAVLFGIHDVNLWDYFWAYWAGMAFSAIISVLVLREIFKYVFAPYPTLPGGTIYSFLSALCAILVFAIAAAKGMAHIEPPPPSWDLNQTQIALYYFQPYILAASHAVEIILFLTTAAICVLATFLGLPWRHHIFGIVAGLSFYFGVQFFVTFLISRTPYDVVPQYIDVVGRVAWQIALFIWIAYMWRPRVLPVTPSVEALVAIRKAVNTVKLKGIIGPKDANRTERQFPSL